MNNQKHAIIVTNQKGIYSIHTGWKSACNDYGWKYTKNRPEKMGDYTIIKQPIGVTINCLELIEFINRENVRFEVQETGETFLVAAICGDEVRQFTTEVRSEQDDQDAPTYFYPTLLVEGYTYDGYEFEIDEHTNSILIDKIDLDYSLNEYGEPIK